MWEIEQWHVEWDVDNKAGFVTLDPAGPQAPFRLGPLPAHGFTAICAVLGAARSAGGRPRWNVQNNVVFF